MAFYGHIPLVEAGPQEEAGPGTFGGAMPIGIGSLPEAKNYALDANTIQWFNTHIIPVLTQARMQRVQLEEEWKAIRRMELMQHDNSRRYMGRSNEYLPLWSRILDMRVSSLSRGLFPSPDYFEVSDQDTGNPETARPVKAYMQWELDTVCKLRTKIKPFIRQLESWGNSVMKFYYRKQLKRNIRSARRPSVASLASSGPAWGNMPSDEGLTISPRSMLYWYIWPTTCEGLADATMCFEDIDVPRMFIEKMQYLKKWENIQYALEATAPYNHVSNQSDILNAFGGSSSDMSGVKNTTGGGVSVLTEWWGFAVLPKSAYLPDEDVECPVPCRAVLANNTMLIEVTRNPFWHQQAPYCFMSTKTNPGFVYGTGAGRQVRPHQYLANDFANQANDVGHYTGNPIVKVNPGLLSGPLAPLAPGRVWSMTDPAGAVFERPPWELVQPLMNMLQMHKSSATDDGGMPPAVQGQNASGSAKTATGQQILQRNAMAPLQDTVEDIENEVMVPLLFAAWINAQQYREDSVMVAVAGTSLRVDPVQLAINAIFRWLGSSQAVNQQQRMQQALGLLQQVMPMAPYLNQLGYIVDPVPLIQRVYNEGMGFRGFEQFIRRAQAMPSAVGPANAQQLPGVQAEQADRIRSATEQAQGMRADNASDMVPGEGEDFMNVRDNADSLAAQAGSSYGGM